MWNSDKVSKRQIERVIDGLQSLLELMEEYNVEEVTTESNTYFCNGKNFIGFTGIGYLPLEEDFEDLVLEEVEYEEEEE